MHADSGSAPRHHTPHPCCPPSDIRDMGRVREAGNAGHGRGSTLGRRIPWGSCLWPGGGQGRKAGAGAPTLRSRSYKAHQVRRGGCRSRPGTEKFVHVSTYVQGTGGPRPSVRRAPGGSLQPASPAAADPPRGAGCSWSTSQCVHSLVSLGSKSVYITSSPTKSLVTTFTSILMINLRNNNINQSTCSNTVHSRWRRARRPHARQTGRLWIPRAQRGCATALLTNFRFPTSAKS